MTLLNQRNDIPAVPTGSYALRECLWRCHFFVSSVASSSRVRLSRITLGSICPYPQAVWLAAPLPPRADL